MPETTIMFCIRARLKEAAEMMGVRPCVRTGLIASGPARDQRVPHIWPSFGQMWETRTSNSKGLAHGATQFSRRHFSRCHSRGYEKVAFFPPPLKRVRVDPACAGRNPGRKFRKRRSCFVSGPDLKRLRKNDGRSPLRENRIGRPCPGRRPEGAPYLAFFWPDVGD